MIIALDGDMPDEDEEKDALYNRTGNIKTDDNDVIHLKVGSVGTAWVEAKYQPVSESDFVGELRGKISNEEIEEYNAALPSKETLEKYLDLYHLYHLIVDYGIASTISVHNIGTAKATDVSVILEFPDEIHVMDIYDVRKLEEPKAPKKPKDLQKVAYERAHPSEVAMEKAVERFDVFKPINLPDLSAYTIRSNAFEAMDVSDNIVSVEIKNGIVHTKWDSFRGIYIVPMKKGEFKAKVELMCAEYEEPEKTELIFVCE